MGEYFINLSKQKLVRKSTYSVLHHSMLMLAKKYVIPGETGFEVITLNADHIFLLCYLMGYIRDMEGSHSYFGSNATLSKDLGVTVRTIQRRLKELSNVGFIALVIDNYSERNIYINYEKIFSEITKILYPEYNSLKNIEMCRKVVEDFISHNLLEKTKKKEYILFLRMEYLKELSKNKISNPIEFLYATLAAKLNYNFEFVRRYCEEAKFAYIKELNEGTTADEESGML